MIGPLPQLQRQRHSGRAGVLSVLPARSTTFRRPNAQAARRSQLELRRRDALELPEHVREIKR